MFLFPFIFVPPPKQTYFKRNESCKLETQGIVLGICVSVFMCKCVFVCCHPFSRVEYRKGQLGPHQLPVYTSFSHSHLWGSGGNQRTIFYSIHNECNNLKVHSADMVAIFSIWTKKSVWFLSDGSAIGDRLLRWRQSCAALLCRGQVVQFVCSPAPLPDTKLTEMAKVLDLAARFLSLVIEWHGM